MKVKSESEVSQSCLTLSDPMDQSLPGSSVHGIFQAKEYWSGVPLPSPENHTETQILGWPKSSFVFFHMMLMNILANQYNKVSEGLGRDGSV